MRKCEACLPRTLVSDFCILFLVVLMLWMIWVCYIDRQYLTTRYGYDADKVKQIPLLPASEPSIKSPSTELVLLLRQFRILADNIVNTDPFDYVLLSYFIQDNSFYSHTSILLYFIEEGEVCPFLFHFGVRL